MLYWPAKTNKCPVAETCPTVWTTQSKLVLTHAQHHKTNQIGTECGCGTGTVQETLCKNKQTKTCPCIIVPVNGWQAIWSYSAVTSPKPLGRKLPHGRRKSPETHRKPTGNSETQQKNTKTHRKTHKQMPQLVAGELNSQRHKPPVLEGVHAPGGGHLQLPAGHGPLLAHKGRAFNRTLLWNPRPARRKTKSGWDLVDLGGLFCHQRGKWPLVV